MHSTIKTNKKQQKMSAIKDILGVRILNMKLMRYTIIWRICQLISYSSFYYFESLSCARINFGRILKKSINRINAFSILLNLKSNLSTESYFRQVFLRDDSLVSFENKREKKKKIYQKACCKKNKTCWHNPDRIYRWNEFWWKLLKISVSLDFE